MFARMRLWVAGCTLLVAAVGCCRQCNLCNDLGGPCGFYSIAGRPHPEYETSKDAPKPEEEKLIPELEKHLQEKGLQEKPLNDATAPRSERERRWR